MLSLRSSFCISKANADLEIHKAEDDALRETSNEYETELIRFDVHDHRGLHLSRMSARFDQCGHVACSFRTDAFEQQAIEQIEQVESKRHECSAGREQEH